MLQTPDHIQCSDAVRALSLTDIWGHGPFREYNESVSLLPGRRITLGYQCWGTLLGVFFLESHSPWSPGIFLLWSCLWHRPEENLFCSQEGIERRGQSHMGCLLLILIDALVLTLECALVHLHFPPSLTGSSSVISDTSRSTISQKEQKQQATWTLLWPPQMLSGLVVFM